MATLLSDRSCAEPQWKNVALFLWTLGVLGLCWLIAIPFLPALVGSITLAVVTNRPYRWLESKVARPGLSAAISVILVGLIIITPTFFLLEELARQGLAAATILREGTPQQKFADLLEHHPAIALRLNNVASQVNLKQASQDTASYLASHLAGLLRNSFRALTQLVLMMFILFFLYRDQRLALSRLRSVLPLTEDEANLLLLRTSDTIHATASGRFVVAAIQGMFAGLAFWVLGVNGAVLWGFVTTLVAIVPAVGAFLVWVPIAVYLALTGHWAKAAILAVWGSLVVSTIDNFLYPALIGSRLRQHTVAVLLSVLGGIALFGVAGIILGPLVLTTANTLLEIWTQRTNSNDLAP